MKKRLIGMLMAVVLVLGLAVPAYADGEALAAETGAVSLWEQMEESAPARDGASDAQNGWSMTDNVWYYYSNGSLRTGWLRSGGAWYYLDPDTGAMVRGWQYIDDMWYYFASSGAMLTGWQYLGGAWYYLDPESGGAMVTGWQTIDGVAYYFSGSGAMARGWQYIDDGWYYFASSGGQQFGWQQIGGLWYYLDPSQNGLMLTGWQTLDDVTYYFWSSGRMSSMPTYIGGEMYYFTGDGALHTNTTLSRCGKTYDVDENGVIVGYVTPAMKQAAGVLNSVGWNLWSAFKWSAGLTYYGRWLRAPSGEVHTEWYANYGFTNYCGNCYIINSTFYQMAKVLGYDVYFVEGGVLNSSGYLAPHGWTEVVINGYAYVFDPEFQHATGMNGYQVWYGKSGTWRYASYSRYYG